MNGYPTGDLKDSPMGVDEHQAALAPDHPSMTEQDANISVAEAPMLIPAPCANFENMRELMHPEYCIYDIDMYQADGLNGASLKHYYDFCNYPGMGLSVTTSSFPSWRKGKKTNSMAKVIPAVPYRLKGSRVFFFDDNINLHLGGGSDIEGIANLRDIETSEYVDFSAGQNGFTAHSIFRYTTVHQSTDYNNVLVQANILDAMTNPDYFQAIIGRFSKPDERLILFVDVNGTTMAEDTITVKSMAMVLMAEFFNFVDICPRPADAPLEIAWPGKPAVSVEKQQSLKSVVNKICNKDEAYYKAFWTLQNCEVFIQKLASQADLTWSRQETKAAVDPADFMLEFNRSHEEIINSPMQDGVPQSWLRCYAALAKGGHHVIMNSFGVDTYRVLKQIAPDSKQILQLTVNYALWSDKDKKLWNAQFEDKAS